MRLLILLPVVVGVGFAQTPVATAPVAPSAPPSTYSPSRDPQNLGRVEGRVVSTGGDPLRKASVHLQMLNAARGIGAPNAGPMSMTNYTSVTDSDGNFVFEDIDAGRYDLSAERNGFVRASYGTKGPGSPSTPVTVSAGQKLTGLVIKLPPQALLAGKVTDEDGDPVAGAQVQLMRSTFNGGKRQLMPANGTSTQPDGSFMIGNLQAGKYYLSATDQKSMMMFRNNRERPGRRGQSDEYVTTYYPNAIDSTSAAPIELTAGIELRGIDLRLRKARVYRIAGQVVAPGGVSPSGIMLTLARQGSSDFNFMNRHMAPIRDKDGWFEFAGVSPGQYIIQTQPGSGIRVDGSTQPVQLLGRAQVNLGNEDINNVVVALGPGAEVAGQFILEGVGPLTAQQRQNLAGTATPTAAPQAGRGGTPAPNAGGQRMNVNLSVAEGMNMGVPGGQVKDDGSFQLKAVPPDKFRINIGGVPQGCYIKAIRFGGQDITRTTLDLTSGSGGALEIVIAKNAAEISGIVRNDKGEAAPDVMLSLWTPGEDAPGGGDSHRMSRTDAGGNFKFQSLPPGDYRIIAWEKVDGGMPQDPEFRKKFESNAAAVKVREGSRETPEVKLVPFDAIEAEASKIR